MTTINDMTEQELITIASNLLAVAKSQGTSRYVVTVNDTPHKMYSCDPSDSVHLDEELSHAYLVNAVIDELMCTEALGYHDLVIVYTESQGYTLMPGKYS